MPRLIVIKGVDEGKQFDLNHEVLGAGRDTSNRIKLHDTEASRRHAEFVRTQEGYRVRDIGSANGTFVNNQSITDVLLKPGDQVQIGQSVLVYSAGPGDSAGPIDLAERISLITRRDQDLRASIIKTVGETEGSRILAHPEQVEGPWLKTALANLGVMYETIQAVSHILDLDHLFERIMDLIFRSLDADCGCIMVCKLPLPDSSASTLTSPGAPLRSADLEPKAIRIREGQPSERSRQGKVSVSRTVVDHVLQNKQGILVTDATRDERFQSAQSLVRFGVREIICVPMKGRHETLGVLYLDTSTPKSELLHRSDSALSPTDDDIPAGSKFTGDHLNLAIAIAHQAALAVEETLYHQALVQAERLAAVGQTIAALSHHIKNILQGLGFGGDMLKKGMEDKDEESMRYGWQLIEKNQGRIYNLVMDMLSYSKEREPSLEATDLNALVQEVLELVASRAQKLDVQLLPRLDPSLPLCLVDREGMHRALLNVVGNGLDAIVSARSSTEEELPPGQLIVTTSREASKPSAHGTASKDSATPDWLRILVQDNGSGIPPEEYENIFRPFISTKGSSGTGLGLPVSRKILREHGGDLLVQSRVGMGTTFIFRIPLRIPQKGVDIHGTTTRHIPLPPGFGKKS